MTEKSRNRKPRHLESIGWWTPGVTRSRAGYVEVLGHRLFYRSFGRPLKGTVLGLVGGPGCPHEVQLPLADLTQFGYRVVLFDQLGCGRSDRPRGKELYSESRAVEEVEELRKRLRLGKVHLFGSSYGGALALDVALRFPKGLNSLVVASGYANSKLSDSVFSDWYYRLPQRTRDRLEKLWAERDFFGPEFAEIWALYSRKHSRLRVWPFDFCYGYYEYFRFLSSSIASAATERLKGWDITDRLPEISLPCLVTAGKYDSVPPACARAIHRGIRGSKLVIFRDGAHEPLWENRVEFIALLRDFFDGLETS